jgi:hypothetical protein
MFDVVSLLQRSTTPKSQPDVVENGGPSSGKPASSKGTSTTAVPAPGTAPPNVASNPANISPTNKDSGKSTAKPPSPVGQLPPSQPPPPVTSPPPPMQSAETSGSRMESALSADAPRPPSPSMPIIGATELDQSQNDVPAQRKEPEKVDAPPRPPPPRPPPPPAPAPAPAPTAPPAVPSLLTSEPATQVVRSNSDEVSTRVLSATVVESSSKECKVSADAQLQSTPSDSSDTVKPATESPRSKFIAQKWPPVKTGNTSQKLGAEAQVDRQAPIALSTSSSSPAAKKVWSPVKTSAPAPAPALAPAPNPVPAPANVSTRPVVPQPATGQPDPVADPVNKADVEQPKLAGGKLAFLKNSMTIPVGVRPPESSLIVSKALRPVSVSMQMDRPTNFQQRVNNPTKRAGAVDSSAAVSPISSSSGPSRPASGEVQGSVTPTRRRPQNRAFVLDESDGADCVVPVSTPSKLKSTANADQVRPEPAPQPAPTQKPVSVQIPAAKPPTAPPAFSPPAHVVPNTSKRSSTGSLISPAAQLPAAPQKTRSSSMSGPETSSRTVTIPTQTNTPLTKFSTKSCDNSESGPGSGERNWAAEMDPHKLQIAIDSNKKAEESKQMRHQDYVIAAFTTRIFIDPFTKEDYNPKTKLCSSPPVPLSIRAQILNQMMSDYSFEQALRELCPENYDYVADQVAMEPSCFKVRDLGDCAESLLANDTFELCRLTMVVRTAQSFTIFSAK